jgi:hypothetical protein
MELTPEQLAAYKAAYEKVMKQKAYQKAYYLRKKAAK